MACAMLRDCVYFTSGKTGTSEEGKCILYSSMCSEPVKDANFDTYMSSYKTNPSVTPSVCTHKQELSVFYENRANVKKCSDYKTNKSTCLADSNCVFNPVYG